MIELKDVPQSSVGAPLPVVLSDEFTILLAYIAEESSAGWEGTAVRIVDAEMPFECLALAEFSFYWSFTFGAPNDEAFYGHPLAARGLRPYGAFRIVDSSWVRQLERMNSIHRNHNPQTFAELRHFVFAFHDSTFECVAQGFTISKYEGTLASLLPIMRPHLRLWNGLGDDRTIKPQLPASANAGTTRTFVSQIQKGIVQGLDCGHSPYGGRLGQWPIFRGFLAYLPGRHCMDQCLPYGAVQ